MYKRQLVDRFIDWVGGGLRKLMIGSENIKTLDETHERLMEILETLEKILNVIIPFFIILLILLVVFSVVWCYILALQKRRNLAQWVLLGIVFNVFAVITLALLPPLTKQTKDESKGVSNKSTNKPPSKKKKKASRIDRKDSNSK